MLPLVFVSSIRSTLSRSSTLTQDHFRFQYTLTPSKRFFADDSLANFKGFTNMLDRIVLDSDVDPDLLKEIVDRNISAVNAAYASYKARIENDPLQVYENPDTNLVGFEHWDKLDPPFGEDVPGRTRTMMSAADVKKATGG